MFHSYDKGDVMATQRRADELRQAEEYRLVQEASSAHREEGTKGRSRARIMARIKQPAWIGAIIGLIRGF